MNNILPYFCGFLLQPTKIEITKDFASLFIPLLLIGTVLLIIAITKLVQTFGQAKLFKVSLTPTQIVEFPKAENVTLYSYTPLFSFAPGLQYELRGLENNQPVESYSAASLLQISGGDGRHRTPLRTFVIKEPGKYQLIIEGLQPNNNYNDIDLSFSRPHNLKAFLWILGVVITGMITMLSFVMTIIALQPK